MENDKIDSKHAVHTIVGRCNSIGVDANNNKLRISIVPDEKCLQFDHTPNGSIAARSEKSLPPNYYSLSNVDSDSQHLSVGASPIYQVNPAVGAYVTMSQAAAANSKENAKDYSTLSKDEVKKEFSELMRTPTVEEVKKEYLKFMDRQEHFQSLRKSIDDIRSSYDGNQSVGGGMQNGTYQGLRPVQWLGVGMKFC